MRGSRIPRRLALLGLCTVLALFAAAPGATKAVPAPAESGSAADLIGVVATGDPRALHHVGINWFLTFGFSGDVPAGMNRAAVVRLTPEPDVDALLAAVAEYPGSAWVVGNEPNVPTVETSDNLSPTDYARLLHRLEGAIHAVDPSAVIVGPNVLNWVDTCGGCAGYQRGVDWTEAFYDAYHTLYGTRPPIDRWSVHSYELDWGSTPTLHADFHQRQLSSLRQWLDSLPEEAGRPIWVTELGFHWAYPGWKFDDHNKIVPVGSYDQAGVRSWLGTMLDWLEGDGVRLGIGRSFLYAQAPPAEAFAAVVGGLALFTDSTASAPLTPAGKQLASFTGHSASIDPDDPGDPDAPDPPPGE